MPTVRNYLSLIKFSHTIFAMPFAMIGFFLAVAPVWDSYFGSKDGWGNFIFLRLHQGTLDDYRYYPHNRNEVIVRLVLVILCMVFARSAAMSFNRYLDRKYDAANPRTEIREIPAGIIKANKVLLFTIANCLLFIACCFFINRLCFYLAPIALSIILGYSYTKRFTPICHLILGLGLSLAPVGAYLAVTGAFHWIPILFSIAVLFWVSGFDIIYALQDEEFDKSQRLYSIPAWLGKAKALRVSEFLHILSAGAIGFAGYLGGFGWLYWVGASLFIGMLIYQHTIVKPNDLKRINLAFMTTNGIASVVFSIFVIMDLFINL